MKRVLVFSDSLGLPRPKPELVKHDETWIHLLSGNYDIQQFSIGGAEVSVLATQIEYAKMFEPDVVIVQSGIVDCAPRALTRNENKFLNKYKVTRFFLKIILKPRIIRVLRKYRNVRYTKQGLFESHVNEFLRAFGTKLFWIGIVPGNEKYEETVVGITRNINDYNSIIKKNLKLNYIGLEDVEKKHVMSDHVHLSKEGHSYLYAKIVNTLNKNS